jgi:uncharacterized protein YecE (DUF72 family)
LAWFLKSGVTELGQKLGPLLWQFAPFKKFDANDFAAFLALLPKEADGVRLRHVVEVRHNSFLVPEFIDLLRKHDVAVALADSDDYPAIADVTADFIYARLQRAEEDVAAGYDDETLSRWADRARIWQSGGEPADLDRVSMAGSAKQARDVFIFMINGAKVRAPAAAQALIERVG